MVYNKNVSSSKPRYESTYLHHHFVLPVTVIPNGSSNGDKDHNYNHNPCYDSIQVCRYNCIVGKEWRIECSTHILFNWL